MNDNDVARTRTDWDGMYDHVHDHCLRRAREIQRVARVHRDRFEPILAIRETDRPQISHRQITSEIWARIPDARRHPKAAAEMVNDILI